MTKFKSKIALLLLGIISCFSVSSFAQAPELKVKPMELYERMIKYGPVKNDKGEGFCWHARVGMDDYINNYLVTNNTEWLDAGVKYYDFLIAKDGYRSRWLQRLDRTLHV